MHPPDSVKDSPVSESDFDRNLWDETRFRFPSFTGFVPVECPESTRRVWHEAAQFEVRLRDDRVTPRNGAASHPNGAVAQLGERCVRNAEVEGSSPFRSTCSRSRLETL